MARKTFNVDDLKSKINAMLANSLVTADRREGFIAILEDVLHETDNYLGYRYLTVKEVPEGHQPGIRYEDGSPTHSFDDCDSTRRQYR